MRAQLSHYFHLLFPKSRSASSPDAVASLFYPDHDAVEHQFIALRSVKNDLIRTLKTSSRTPLIYGPPGVGKTSLAKEARRQVRGLTVDESNDDWFQVDNRSNHDSLLYELWTLVKGEPPGETTREIKVGGGAGIEGEITKARTTNETAALWRLAKAIVESQRIFIIDEIEKLCSSDLTSVLVLAKQVSDQAGAGFRAAGRLILIAVSKSTAPYFADDDALRARFDLFRLHPWEPKELRRVSRRFRRLGLSCAKNSYKRIHYHSCGYPRWLHEICRRSAERAIEVGATTVDSTIQHALENIGGSGTLREARDTVERKIAHVSETAGLRQSDVRSVAVAAAAWPTIGKVSRRNLDRALSKCDTVLSRNALDAAIDGLIRHGVIEYDLRDNEEAGPYYTFVLYADRLALRFMLAQAHLSHLRDDADFRQGYDFLSGDH